MDTRTPNQGLSRRSVVKAAAWSAPVIVLAAAAPGVAASTGDVPIAVLEIQSYGVTDAGGQGVGPLQWAGGQILYTAGDPSVANVSYTIVAIFPDGTETTLRSGSVAIPAYGAAEITGPILYGEPPMPAGEYTLVSTVFGSDGAKSVTDTVTLTG
ncbi:MAG: hypothetical protein ACTHNQ_07135 [Microbacterium sp.]|uniref:hypothetical protein n=1 Tax=Microbacterium sp. TaxID=51671 RepID=UPI003F7D77DC